MYKKSSAYNEQTTQCIILRTLAVKILYYLSSVRQALVPNDCAELLLALVSLSDSNASER